MQTSPTRQPSALATPGFNPLASPGMDTASHYMDPSNGQLRYRAAHPATTLSRADRDAHASIRDHVMQADYPCVMGRSAFNRNAYRLATYGALDDADKADNALMLCHDLYTFCAEFPQPVQGAVSFIAWFEGPAPADERSFESALWAQLQALHDVDRRHFDWSPDVGSQPSDPNFSFSVGGRAFFLIGMHAHASRDARRTRMPVIVFNLHEQFVELRTQGKFEGVRDTIQVRDKALQGSTNPMSADFGKRSEAAQYSGRAVARDWVCPFAPA